MNKLVFRILQRLGILNRLNIVTQILVNGKRFKIPILETIGYPNLSITERWMIELLKIILPLGDKKFIDVGVNIGQTLLKLRSISLTMSYIGFEPNPACIHYTSRLIKENGFITSELIPVGISDKTELGKLNLFFESKTDSTASIIADFRSGRKIDRTEYIPLLELDGIRKTVNLDGISILKIDVEGAELEVLKSFATEIEKQKPIILLEILPAYNEQNKIRIERQNEIQNLLKQFDYSIFKVIKQNDILSELIEIKEIGIHSDLDNCDYIMIPDTKKQRFRDCYQRYCDNKKVFG
jgi:FkbM family methyltransferase